MTTGEGAAARRANRAPRIGDAPQPVAPSATERATEAVDWLTEYAPVSIEASTWTAVRPFVVEAAAELVDKHGVYRQPLPKYVRALTKLAVYCRDTNQQLKVSTALDPYTVNQFAAALAKSDPANAGTYQSQLRFVGERLLPAAPWEKPAPVSQRTVPLPYSDSDLDLLADQIAKNSPARRRGGEGLMALGLGAGLDGRWSAKVEKEHVVDSDGGLDVRVDGRLVPVLSTYEDLLRQLREDTPKGGLIVGGNARNKNAANEIARRLVLDPSCPRLHAGRCRSTWIVTHLTLGTRLRELTDAAGTAGITTFSDLLEFVPPLSPDPEDAQLAARAMLRGRG